MINVTTNNDLQCNRALAALQNITDPEIGLNIVDLGLIYQIDFDEEAQKIYCTMTLTTQFCPMGESITNAVEEIMKDSFPEYEIIITLTFNPRWTHERISVEGKQFLNY
jgi:metal-sulfur cluster biosynthetic enzyme